LKANRLPLLLPAMLIGFLMVMTDAFADSAA
jgi:hypothetical protein